jgi:hypothetical protein
VQLPVHGQAEGRVGERGTRHGTPGAIGAELPGEQIGAGEGERVRQQEEEVVAGQRGGLARTDQPGRRVAEQRVREGQAVGERPERVRVEEGERLGQQRVPLPGELPRGSDRVAEVLGDVVVELEEERPAHRDGQQSAAEKDQAELTRAEMRRSPEAGVACALGARAAPARAPGGVCGRPVGQLRHVKGDPVGTQAERPTARDRADGSASSPRPAPWRPARRG